jgi:hypothetical protein
MKPIPFNEKRELFENSFVLIVRKLNNGTEV